MHNFCSLLCQCCVWGSLDIVVNHCQSEDLSTNLDFIFYFNFSFTFNFDVKFLSYWLNAYGILNENRQQNGDPFYGQTLCHTWVAMPRYHCIVSSPWFYLSLGWRHEMYETKKQVGSGLVAKVKNKKRLEKMTWWQANYEKRLHFFEDVSILLWHITTTTHNLY